MTLVEEKSNYLFGFLDMRFVQDVTRDWKTLKISLSVRIICTLIVTYIVDIIKTSSQAKLI